MPEVYGANKRYRSFRRGLPCIMQEALGMAARRYQENKKVHCEKFILKPRLHEDSIHENRHAGTNFPGNPRLKFRFCWGAFTINLMVPEEPCSYRCLGINVLYEET